jgi:hypothetical protein
MAYNIGEGKKSMKRHVGCKVKFFTRIIVMQERNSSAGLLLMLHAKSRHTHVPSLSAPLSL